MCCKTRLPKIIFFVTAFFISAELYGQGSLSASVSVTNTICNYNNGIIRVTATGGTPPYMYNCTNMNGGFYTGIFANIPEGTYNIDVYDATFATVSVTATVTNTKSKPYLLNWTATSPTGCFTNDGVINVVPGGGVAPYMFSINNGLTYQNSPVFNNLGAGGYHIFVKDNNGCVAAPWSPINGSYLNFQYYFIGYNGIPLLNTNCPVQVYTLPSGPTCNGLGFIDINYSSGGTPPYTYSLDGVNFAPLTTNGYFFLQPGAYTVYVKDAAGVITSFYEDLPRNCGITASVTGASCNQNNGSITITGTNGIAPYTYAIDGLNFQPSNVFSGLAAGHYTIISKDVNGATISTDILVPSGCPEVTAVVTNENCGQQNGTITASGSGGTAPYTYSVDGVNFQNAALFTGLASGTYTVTVKDAAGFTGTKTVTVLNNCITFTVVITAATCGNNNGSVTITPANGTAPYQYSIDGGSFQSSNIFLNLAATAHTVTLKDANGLTVAQPVVINNIAGPQVNAVAGAATCTDNDGTISISQSGGTSPFQYSVDGSAYNTPGNFTGLASGIHTAYVKDANGCVASQQVTVPLTNNLSITAGNNSTICEGSSVTLQATSNANAFTWSPAAGLTNAAVANPVASPVATTVYTVTGKTGSCTKTSQVTVFVNKAPTANAGSDVSVCYGKPVQLHGNGGVKYTWLPATGLDDNSLQQPTVLNPLSTSTYKLTVTDGNNCQSLQADPVLVTVRPPATVSAGNDTAVAINQPLLLHATDVNNTGFTNYLWSPAQGLNDASLQHPLAFITKDITYTVVATTPEGCQGTKSVTIKVFAFTDILVPSAFTPNGDGKNDVLKVIPVGIKTLRYFNIYNKWGQLVFSTTTAGKGWDGTVNGSMPNSGSFVWIASGTDYNGNTVERKGSVVLIR